MSVWRSETINIGISKCVTKGTRRFNSCSGNYHELNIPVYIVCTSYSCICNSYHELNIPECTQYSCKCNSSSYSVTKSYMYVSMVMHADDDISTFHSIQSLPGFYNISYSVTLMIIHI